MCCAFTILVVLGPRFGGAIWWLVNPLRWERAFTDWPIASWLWSVLGIIFLPWTTLMYVIVFQGPGWHGIAGWDWLWIGLGLLADIAWYSGAAARRRMPGYSGTY